MIRKSCQNFVIGSSLTNLYKSQNQMLVEHKGADFKAILGPFKPNNRVFQIPRANLFAFVTFFSLGSLQRASQNVLLNTIGMKIRGTPPCVYSISSLIHGDL